MIKSLQTKFKNKKKILIHLFFTAKIIKQIREIFSRNDEESDGCSASGMKQMPMEEFILEIESNAITNTFGIFLIDNDPQVVFDDEKSYFGML